MTFGRRASTVRTTLVTAVGLVAVVASALAQRGGYVVSPSNPAYDGRFMFARLSYTVGPGGYYYFGMPAWAHGYPHAEENLMKIMDAISTLHPPHINESVVMNVDDPNLSKFPVAYMTEAGFWTMTDNEATAFRAYLLKGGFVIFDDFRDAPRGGGGWANFEYNMQRVIPHAQFIDLDVSHPIFHSFFQITRLDILPQAYDRGRPVIRGLFENNDPTKRLMAVINFNTDIADFWEFSGEGRYPVNTANEAFKLGVNYLIYGLTH
jgi:Domain of unknown function (DUF4159)